jgi:hypothetical protein
MDDAGLTRHDRLVLAYLTLARDRRVFRDGSVALSDHQIDHRKSSWRDRQRDPEQVCKSGQRRGIRSLSRSSEGWALGQPERVGGRFAALIIWSGFMQQRRPGHPGGGHRAQEDAQLRTCIEMALAAVVGSVSEPETGERRSCIERSRLTFAAILPVSASD